MNHLKKYWYRLLVPAIFLALVLGFPSFVFSYIIEPIAVLLWVAWRTILTVDQNMYWLMLIVVCCISMLRFVPSWKRRTRPAYSYKYASRNRVEHWQALLGDSILGGNDSGPARENLERLICSVLTLSHGSSLGDVPRRIADGQISVPPEIRYFLFPSQAERKRLFKLQQLYARFLPEWLGRQMKPDAFDATLISKILAWMENDLEIKHEP